MSKSDNLFQKTQDGEDIFSAFSGRIQKNLLIFDKTIDEWWKHFGLRIDYDNLNPENCKELLKKIANLYQEASYYYSLASSSSDALESSQSSSHTEKYAEVVNSYRDKGEKVPAAATVDQLVRAEQDEIYNAIATSKITRNFFKTILDSLNTCRKTIDTATINSGIEAKLANVHSYTEHRNGDD
jgi:hypothetical protein